MTDSFIQDCEVCGNPWRVRVSGRGEHRTVEVAPGDGSSDSQPTSTVMPFASQCSPTARIEGGLGAMGRLLVVLLGIAAASGCASPPAPSPSLAGTWSEQFSIPGARLVLTLDAFGTGNGTYAIEAGRSGSVQVAGAMAASAVTLSIRYDYGIVRTFTGALTDANHLTGTFDDAQGTVVFVRS